MSVPAGGYVGRFAPSPTGPLHAGSLVAALASWLDARAHHGQWLVRIEDVDTPRCQPGLGAFILTQLAACGLQPDLPPVSQSQRQALYQQALDTLVARDLAYPCACSRKDIEAALAQGGHARPRHGELIYPGTCRHGLADKPGRAWRLRTNRLQPNQALALTSQGQAAIDSVVPTPLQWTDRRLGRQQQCVATEVGDFVLKRADGCTAYQLAVVVDDAAQSITDVVRGEDLCDNTPRQIWLQHALGYPTPRYLHTPLVYGPNGEKLSKQNHAQAVDIQHPLRTLNQAAQVLGLPAQNGTLAQALHAWTLHWLASGPPLYNPAP